MVLKESSFTLAFVGLVHILSIGFSTQLESPSMSEVDATFTDSLSENSDAPEETPGAFARISTHITAMANYGNEKHPTTKEYSDEILKAISTDIADLGNEKVASAATTMLAMAFSYGLVSTSANPSSLTGGDAEKIASALAQYVIPAVINNRLVEEYNEHVAAGKSPVEAMGLAMEYYNTQKKPQPDFDFTPVPTLYPTRGFYVAACLFRRNNKDYFSKISKWASGPIAVIPIPERSSTGLVKKLYDYLAE